RELGAVRPRAVLGAVQQGLLAAGSRAPTAGLRSRAVVGPERQYLSATRRRAAACGLRPRAVVGPDDQCLPATGRWTAGTAGRVNGHRLGPEDTREWLDRIKKR